MRERTINRFLANISANNAIFQIVLILILFSQVRISWDWDCFPVGYTCAILHMLS